MPTTFTDPTGFTHHVNHARVGGVTALVHPDLPVEVEVVAVVPEAR